MEQKESRSISVNKKILCYYLVISSCLIGLVLGMTSENVMTAILWSFPFSFVNNFVATLLYRHAEFKSNDK